MSSTDPDLDNHNESPTSQNDNHGVTFSCGKQTRNAKEFMEVLETVELPFPRGAALDQTAYQEWIKLTTEYQEFKISHPGRKGGKNGQCKWTPLKNMINEAADTQMIAQSTGKRRFVSAMVSYDKLQRAQVFIDTTKELSLHFATLTVPAKGVIPVEELIPCAAKWVAEDPTTTWADFLAFCKESLPLMKNCCHCSCPTRSLVMLVQSRSDEKNCLRTTGPQPAISTSVSRPRQASCLSA